MALLETSACTLDGGESVRVNRHHIADRSRTRSAAAKTISYHRPERDPILCILQSISTNFLPSIEAIKILHFGFPSPKVTHLWT